MEEDELPLPPPKKQPQQETEDVLLLPPPPPKKKEEPLTYGSIIRKGVGFLGGIAEGLVKSTENVITNTIPQEYKTEDLRKSGGTLASYINPSQREGDANIQTSGFDFPEADDLKAQYSRWVFKQPDTIRQLDNEKRAEIFLKEKLGDKGYQDLANKFNNQLGQYRSLLESEIQKQKSESGEELNGIPQSYKDINSFEDVGKYIGQLGGQGFGRIATSVATAGSGSVIAERAAVYDRQLDQLAEALSQKTGEPLEQSRQKIVQLQQDYPEAGKNIADLAAMLDIAAIPTLEGGLVGKVLPPVIEGTTEAIQSELEEKGATQGSGAEYSYDPTRTVDSFLGGVIGAKATQVIIPSVKEKKINTVIDQVADTGNPAINATIDAGAELTEEEKQTLKQKQYESKIRNGESIQSSGKSSSEVGSEESSSGGILSRSESPRKIGNDEVSESEKEITNAEAIRSNEGQVQETGTPSESSQNEGSENLQLNAQEQSSDKEKQITFNETPEYKQADEGVRAIADELRSTVENPDISRSELTDIFKRLNEAKQERDNARIAAEKATAKQQQEKQEALIIKNPAKALKEQIKQHYQHIAEGVRKGQKGKNELLEKVNEVIKKATDAGFTFNNKQVNAIVNKVKATNLFTAGSVSKLNNFIDNTFNDADYANKLSEAKSINGKLRKAAKKSSSNLQNIKSLAKAFAKINPEDTFINEHLRIGNELYNALTSPTKDNYAINNLEYVDEYIKKKIDEYNEGVEEEVKEVEKTDDEETLKELQSKLQSSLNKLNNKDLSEFDEQEKVSINKIKKVAPARLSKEQLITAIRVVDNINENDNLSNEAQVETDADVQESLDNLNTLVGDQKLSSPTSVWSKVFNSVPRFWDSLFNDRRKAYKAKSIIGQQDLVVAGSKVEQAKVARTKEIEKILKQFEHKTKQKFLDIKNRSKVLVYSLMVRHPQGVDPNTHLEQIKQNIKNSIEEYKIAGEDETVKALQEAFNEVKDLNTLQEIETKWSALNPEHKKVFDYFVKMHESIADQHEQTSANVFNEPYIRENNYTHMEMFNLNGKTSSNLDVKAGDGFNNKSVKPKLSETAIKSTRKLRPGWAYSTDWIVDQLHAYGQTMYSNEAAKAQMKLHKIINSPELTQILGRENAQIVKKQSERINEMNQGLGGMPSDEFLKALSAVAQVGRELGAVTALGSLSQAPRQLLPVLANAMVYHTSRGSFPLLLKAIRVRSEGVKKLHAMYPIGTVGLRLGGIDRGDTISYNLSGAPVKKLFRVLETIHGNISSNARRALGALTTFDRYGKQSLWNSYYMLRLKELGLKDVNMNEEWSKQNEAERKEAAAFAEHMISTTQIASNPAEFSAITSSDRNTAKSILKNIFLPFAIYSIETKARLVSEVKMSWKNPSSENFTRIAGTLAEVAAFEAIMVTLIPPYKEFIKGTIRELFDIDEPDKDKEKEEDRIVKNSIARSINTLNPLAIGTPGEEAFNHLMNLGAFKLLADDPDLTYKEWKQKTGGFAFEGKQADYGLLSLGWKPFSQMSKNVVNLTRTLDDEKVHYEDDFGNEYDVYLDDNQRRLLVLNTLIEAASMNGIVEADIYNSIRNVYKEQIKAQRGEGQEPQKKVIRRPILHRPVLK